MDEKEIVPIDDTIQNINDENENLTVTNTKRSTKFNVESPVYSFLMIFGMVFLVCILVFQIILTPIKVIGTSMSPTINQSVTSEKDEDHCDIVYYNKSSVYQNDDIVIVANNQNEYIKRYDVDFFIKRVVACPGQTITFYRTDTDILTTTYYYDIVVKDTNGNVIELDDSYKNEQMKFTASEYYANKHLVAYENIFGKLKKGETASITLTANSYFVMGDNRNNSEDSRFFGPVNYNDISGEVRLHVPYGKNIWQSIFLKLKSSN